ncbi:conserved hypothetical protein [uncultured Desulfobacterium sp.]|uniref:Uncharacterized protein n=1 Tax=uncultured Desulfobacterium sp. TaxID=201089 RepID=A0A445MRH7_9BACT|nr:conserved hypothetical protein [uncultured Desulfobacterium sp.]
MVPGGQGKGLGGMGRGSGGKGKGGGPGMGQGGECICPKCGERQPHVRGNPCFDIKCPKCGSSMTRA